MKRNVSDDQTPLAKATADAISSGNPNPLYAFLCRVSYLPGPHANLEIARIFADMCTMHTSGGEKLAKKMASLDADEAPGGTDLEYLPVCGVLAVAACATHHERSRADMLDVLHDRADDLRFRVRDAVVEALAKIGHVAGDALLLDTAPWMDGYFHAAAVLRAVVHENWLPQVHDIAVITMRLDEAFALARNAPRAAARYPGRKALIESLRVSPGLLANRFGVPIFDLLEKWAAVDDPELREIVVTVLGSKNLVARYRPEVDRVKDALKASAPSVRDPRTIVGPTRRRGKKGR
ncbi:MAG: hypothetical protein ABI461_02625 [Polyangiaceae bacterium]